MPRCLRRLLNASMRAPCAKARSCGTSPSGRLARTLSAARTALGFTDDDPPGSDRDSRRFARCNDRARSLRQVSASAKNAMPSRLPRSLAYIVREGRPNRLGEVRFVAHFWIDPKKVTLCGRIVIGKEWTLAYNSAFAYHPPSGHVMCRKCTIQKGKRYGAD